MKTVHIVGMGTGRQDLAGRHRDVIAGADVLVGAGRHLELFAQHPARKKEISSPVSGVIEYIRAAMADDLRVVVLATGDPMFYGIGKTLAEDLGEKKVAVVPNVSIMAEAFARIGKSWNDAAVVSLHGRAAETGLVAALAGTKPVFLYTDPGHPPDWAARVICERTPDRWQICVFERLGESGENIAWMAPRDAAGAAFAEPNSVLLWPDEKSGYAQSPVLGGPEESYAHERGMITKSEVRAVTLSKLRLAPEHVLWDLGAGSGSISIEAGLFITRGRIVAVEKNAARVHHIRENRRRFNIPGLEVHRLDLPGGMDGLPDPDRVFVGGGGRDIAGVLRQAAGRLPAGGRIVVNAVVLETVTASLAIFRELGLAADVVELQVGMGAEMPAGTRISAANPVFVVTGER